MTELYRVAQAAHAVLCEIEKHAAQFPSMRLPSNTAAQNELRAALNDSEWPSVHDDE